jgi:hypothetical protein
MTSFIGASAANWAVSARLRSIRFGPIPDSPSRISSRMRLC